MSLIGNIIWFILIGLWSAIAWILLGIMWCITIIGIPIGVQCFKFAKLSACPFGKKIVESENTGWLILNILWIIFGGLEMAVGYLVTGLILCITIIGIPFGKQCFKLMKLSLVPLGTKIE